MPKKSESKKTEEQGFQRKRFGQFLTRLREDKKVSIRAVADGTGISDPFLYQIEKGEKSLTSPEYFFKLATYFGIEVSELLRQAGYLPMSDVELDLAKAVDTVSNDKNVPHLGASFFAKLTREQKLDVIHLYRAANRIKSNDALEIFR